MMDKEKELNEIQFLNLCRSPDMKEYLRHLYNRKDVTPAEVKEMKLFQILDSDGSGLISTKELVNGCERLTRTPTVLDLAAFRQMTTDQIERIEATIKENHNQLLERQSRRGGSGSRLPN